MVSEKNKVLWAYIAADVLFVVMGAVMVGFAVVVQNEIKVQPTDGEQAARNLLYSRFPLTGRLQDGSPRRRRRRHGEANVFVF